MININGKYIYCNALLGCPERIRNNLWGRFWANGWWFSREDDIAFCPKHTPQNLFVWRQLK